LYETARIVLTLNVTRLLEAIERNRHATWEDCLSIGGNETTIVDDQAAAQSRDGVEVRDL
jgi:hypothetical protein